MLTDTQKPESPTIWTRCFALKAAGLPLLKASTKQYSPSRCSSVFLAIYASFVPTLCYIWLLTDDIRSICRVCSLCCSFHVFDVTCYCPSSPLCCDDCLCDKGDAGSVCKLVPSLLKSLLHHLPLDSGCSRLNSLLSLPGDDSQVSLLTFQLHFTYPNSSHRTTPSIPFISLFWQSFISNANQSSSRRNPIPWCSAAGTERLVSWGSTGMHHGGSLIFLFFFF